MDGLHDIGGKQGFGPVRYTNNAPSFHAPWEQRVNAMYSLAVRHGVFNMDEYRHAIERMEPRHYVAASYYERTLTSLATLCVEKKLVTVEELERLALGRFPLARRSAHGRGNARSYCAFAIGDRVRACTALVAGHVRMPGYVRGKTGVIVGESPAYFLPDAHAHGIVADKEVTYDVRFDAMDLWPDAAEPAFVHVGLFQSYLEPA